MTIGIACYGKNAVAAAIAAVLGAELLGRGEIGGFAVLAILAEDGELQQCCVQRGGVSGLEIPDIWHRAKTAAIISSGPDRPEPLVQFLPGESGMALVTGHRIPTSLNQNGIPVNQALLALLMEGCTAQDAVDSVLKSEPEMDVGLIALTAKGDIAWANSLRVARRPDIGNASKLEADRGYALLHNSIYSNHINCTALAQTLGDLAWAELSAAPQPFGFLRLNKPVTIRYAEKDLVIVDNSGNILALETANHALLSGQYAFRSVVYGAPPVECDGQHIGHAATELFARIDEGIVYPHERLADQTMIIRRSLKT